MYCTGSYFNGCIGHTPRWKWCINLFYRGRSELSDCINACSFLQFYSSLDVAMGTIDTDNSYFLQHLHYYFSRALLSGMVAFRIEVLPVLFPYVDENEKVSKIQKKQPLFMLNALACEKTHELTRPIFVFQTLHWVRYGYSGDWLIFSGTFKTLISRFSLEMR